MKPAVLEQKVALVDEIVAELKGAESAFLMEYAKLSVEQLQKLRRDLAKENATLRVFKNTLVGRALHQMGYKGLESHLEGPNALVISKKDLTAGPRLIAKFAKRNPSVKVKGGIVEKQVATPEQIALVATLPGKSGMHSMLLGVLVAPVRNLAYALKTIADQKAA